MNMFIAMCFFILSFSSLAVPGFYSVGSDNTVQATQSGLPAYLSTGDLIQVKDNQGLNRNINIINTITPGLSPGAASLRESDYNFFLSNQSLLGLGQTSSSMFLTRPMDVQFLNGQNQVLPIGSQLNIQGIDGWQRNIEVVNYQNKGNIDARIKNSTYLDYKNSGGFSEDRPRLRSESESSTPESSTSYIALDNLVNKMNIESANEIESVAEEEILGGVEIVNNQQPCPVVGKTFKLDRFLSAESRNKYILGVPRGSSIRIKSNGSKCAIEVTALPPESNLNLKIFQPEVLADRESLHPDFLTEILALNKNVNLSQGIKLNLNGESRINAYGRKTGKLYEFTPQDEITILGKHRNGDYLVKRNSEASEYRIPYEDLDELNQNGQISINLIATAVSVVSTESVDNTLKIIEPEYDCEDVGSTDDTTAPFTNDIEWQKCRSSNTNIDGNRSLDSNDYMDKEIPVSSLQANKILENPEKRQFAKCISVSLRHGTNRSSNPSCEKDSSGNILPKRIRQATYRTSGGKKQFSGWTLLSKAPKSCASKELSTHLADRYVDMTKCLGLDPKELFPIINHESHFQPKTISPTFALGVGQIVPVNYLDFYNKLNQVKSMVKSNSSLLDYGKTLATKEGYKKYENSPSSTKKVSRFTAFFLSDLKDKMTSSRPECAGLKRLYDNPFTLPSSAKNDTGKANDYLRDRENLRLCTPNNPDEGFYMAAIYYMNNKKYFSHMLEEENKNKNLKMTPKQISDYAIILARWSYNGGVAGISGPFERFIEKIKEGSIEVLNQYNDPSGSRRSVDGLSNLSNDDFKSYMSYVIKHRYRGGDARRGEVSRYMSGASGSGGIDGDLKQTEKGEEGSCGITY